MPSTLLAFCVEYLGGFPRWLSGKESACQCSIRKRCRFDTWVGKIPWRRKWCPTPVFLPGKSHGQRSLAGYVHGVTRVSYDWATGHRHHGGQPWCIPSEWACHDARGILGWMEIFMGVDVTFHSRNIWAPWACLVVQWLRICLPMQGTWVWFLLWENPTCHRATKPMLCNH